MSKLFDLFTEGMDYCKDNSPLILSGAACIGVLGTIVLGVRAGKKICKKEEKVASIIEEKKTAGTEVTKKESRIMYVKAQFPEIIPVLAVGTLSIVCTIASYKISAKRIAALTTAYTLTSKAFDEYKKATQKILGDKEKEIEREKQRKQMEDNPPPKGFEEDKLEKVGQTKKTADDIYQTIPCWYDEVTNQYFKASEAQIEKAFGNVKNKLRCGTYDFVSLNDFYRDLDNMGCDVKTKIKVGDDVGWNSDQFPNGPLYDLSEGAKAPNGLFVGKLDYDYGYPISFKGIRNAY